MNVALIIALLTCRSPTRRIICMSSVTSVLNLKTEGYAAPKSLSTCRRSASLVLLNCCCKWDQLWTRSTHPWYVVL